MSQNSVNILSESAMAKARGRSLPQTGAFILRLGRWLTLAPSALNPQQPPACTQGPGLLNSATFFGDFLPREETTP